MHRLQKKGRFNKANLAFEFDGEFVGVLDAFGVPNHQRAKTRSANMRKPVLITI